MSGTKEALRKEVADLRETVEALRAELAGRPVTVPCCSHVHYTPPGCWTCSMCGSLVSGFHICAGSPYKVTCGAAAGGVSTMTLADAGYSQVFTNTACAAPAPVFTIAN